MGKHGKSIFFGLLIGLFSFVIVESLFNPSNLLSLLIGLVVGAGLTIFLIARSRGEKAEELVMEAVQQATQPDPGANERLVQEQLTQFNEQIRMAGINIEVIELCEELIDLLREVVPHALEKSPGSETTFDLEQLATTHLPRLVKAYIDLNSSERTAQQDLLLQQLLELKTKVAKLAQHLSAGDLQAFQVEHGFLDQKY